LLYRVGMARDRQRMIDSQLVRRGISDARVLDAFRALPRETFVPERMGELAYEDSPLPIGEGQTISQPFIVALTLEAMQLRGDERVLEIGTGSGYAAALLGLLAKEVYTVERIADLAETARQHLRAAGSSNVTVIEGDGSLGLPDHAPYDAIAVAAAGPRVPDALRMQLAVGGRLVIPVGDEGEQHLVRVTRVSDVEWREERLLAVSFVPLIGAEAWPDAGSPPPRDDRETVVLVRRNAISFEGDAIPNLIEHVGHARVVVLGGSVDGSAELQRARARLTWQLVAHAGFSMVAIEGDWHDAARIDEHVRERRPRTSLPLSAFCRFADLRWRNAEVGSFFDALHDLASPPSVHGLDMYATSASVAVALERLEESDPERAEAVRAAWNGISPWRRSVAELSDGVDLEEETIATLIGMLDTRVDASREEGKHVRDAVLRACEGAEDYYRRLLHGTLDVWKLREEHMFTMLRALLADHGPKSKVVVWANDAHVADGRATETGVRGHVTLGQRCRNTFGRDAYLVGMSAARGEILASPSWGEPPVVTELRPPVAGSYEAVFADAAKGAFFLALRGADPALREALLRPRLARCIGPVYCAFNELATHWLSVSLAAAFDAVLFREVSSAVRPIAVHPVAEPEGVHPLHA
jgi:protein-L-isoaspartate(D-aspartate) O-methyltransferase